MMKNAEQRDFITEQHINDGGNRYLPLDFIEMYGPRASMGNRFFTYFGTFPNMERALDAITQPGLKREYLPGVALDESRLYKSPEPTIVVGKVGTWGLFKGGVQM
jgi:hypothetical protein